MGVDINAYPEIEIAREPDGNTDPEWWDAVPYAREFYNNPEFVERGDTYHEGERFRGEPVGRGASLSYGGYNRWREWLSLKFLGVTPETVWDRYEEYKKKPFASLIHFSDCEGFFGPEHVKLLAAEFEEHEGDVPLIPGEATQSPDAYGAYWYHIIAGVFRRANKTGRGVVRFS